MFLQKNELTEESTPTTFEGRANKSQKPQDIHNHLNNAEGKNLLSVQLPPATEKQKNQEQFR